MDELHGDESNPFRFVDLVDNGDVRVLECGRRLGFLDEASFAFRGGNQLGWKDLESDFSVQFGVDGAVDDAHTTATDLGNDVVVRKGPPDHGTPPFLLREFISPRIVESNGSTMDIVVLS
jgi:hypothetical protein